MGWLNKLKQLSAENSPTSPKEGGVAIRERRQCRCLCGGEHTVTGRQGERFPIVFNPGSNLFTKAIGAEILDKPPPSAATG
ncbi:unnamed protein product [Spirodela intermedia]|uniref:Uncharacterized protein n=1 Tax=Spirodela intermedia TaxID=51605 RepID=A0A7I8IMS1_SPIIN|nr:unnamed protein product [Spirodela intermedia]CAA6658436.1 unnamed protein product [Spirodela intermedia]